MTGKKQKNWKRILLKAGILVLILVSIVGIYFVKNSNEVENSTELTVPLEVEEINLEELKSYGLPFVIDFGSDDCIPCKQMAPVLVTLHEDFKDKAIIQFVDVWKNQESAIDFPVSVIPTQVFYNADGSPFMPSEKLAQEIEFMYYSSRDTNEHLFTIHQGGITEEQMRKIFSEMGVQ